ncbi:hypothetical protein P154DRAFT_223416 [Amniculicola lignicola CBS 123094]|uniref:Uncharacterized protein n=1 Tax=Amniculicola lignicola CBS 123094 TaxID=1392246 RepID=A0A6A5WY26_9PLEO|nr:hypothetical protein P154DRAFT_223416 [Amniculicola lignicola CBS 123094]
MLGWSVEGDGLARGTGYARCVKNVSNLKRQAQNHISFESDEMIRKLPRPQSPWNCAAMRRRSEYGRWCCSGVMGGCGARATAPRRAGAEPRSFRSSIATAQQRLSEMRLSRRNGSFGVQSYPGDAGFGGCWLGFPLGSLIRRGPLRQSAFEG